MSGGSLDEAVAATAALLAAAGIAEARREARLLVIAAAGLDEARLLGHGADPLDAAAAHRLDAMAGCRAARVPMAQVLGRRGFWEREFRVTADTLTPRPESETLIEAALALVRPEAPPRRVLDLGTGTGCLLLTLLDQWPGAWGLGVDRSAAALGVARANAIALGLAGRAAFVQADWTGPLGACFDLVVANPPYVESAAIATLEPEVALHEPRLALDGGPDGLAPYRAILPCLPSLLAPAGLALFEHGAGQRDAIVALALASGLVLREARDDLAGIDRCLAFEIAPRTAEKKELGKHRNVD